MSEISSIISAIFAIPVWHVSAAVLQRWSFQCSCHTAQWAILEWPWWMRHGEDLESLCCCRLSAPWRLRRAPSVASRLWHMVSPVICGRVEVEERRTFSVLTGSDGCFLFCPLSIMLLLSFFPLWRTVALWGTGFILHNRALMTGYYSTFLENNQPFFKGNWTLWEYVIS